MRHTNIFDCTLITLKKNHQEKGNLTVVENDREVPFKIKRCYYL